MIYIYDVLLNFTDTDKVYEFFEWDTNDTIEHIKKIPLYRVSSSMFRDLFDHRIQVVKDFLLEIANECEVFRERQLETIPYASLFTDGKRAMAVEFDKEGNSIFRSHLLLDEEEEILDIALRLDEVTISYQLGKKNRWGLFFTRSEEMIKKYLIKEIKSTYQKKEEKKLLFLYHEFFNDKETDMEKMYKKLTSSCDDYLTDSHRKLYQLLKLTHKKKQV